MGGLTAGCAEGRTRKKSALELGKRRWFELCRSNNLSWLIACGTYGSVVLRGSNDSQGKIRLLSYDALGHDNGTND